MVERRKIERGSVQETLIIPLYGRKMCSEKFPNLYQDKSAARLCESLDYDFSEIKKGADGFAYEFGSLEAAMRQIDMECEIREQLIEVGEREKNISSDLTSVEWMEQIDASEGAVLFAAGVFHYLTTEQVRTLAQRVAERMPGARLVFDVINKRGQKTMMKTVLKNWDMQNASALFYSNDPQGELSSWVPGASVQVRGYMLGYNDMKDPAIKGSYRLLAKLADKLMGMQIVRMDFA